VVEANSLPKPAFRTALLAQPAEKTAVRAPAATQNVLAKNPSKSDDDVAIALFNAPLSRRCKAPQAESSSERHDRDLMRNNMRGRIDPVFAAEQMNLMPEISQPFGRPIKIPLSPPFEIQTLMNKGDLQVSLNHDLQ
jgi:hypothetical protein